MLMRDCGNVKTVNVVKFREKNLAERTTTAAAAMFKWCHSTILLKQNEMNENFNLNSLFNMLLNRAWDRDKGQRGRSKVERYV